MNESERVLRAAEMLVERGVLAPVGDHRIADVIVEGRGFRYPTSFWQRVGALVREGDGASWRTPLEGAADAGAAVFRVAVEWAAVGAPLEWARGQGRTAIETFVHRFTD